MRQDKEIYDGEINNKNRMQLLGGIISFAMLLLIIRVFFIQIIDGQEYKSMAERQQQYKINHSSTRGTIYDRNKIPLTNVEDAVLLFVDSMILEEAGNMGLIGIGEEDTEILGKNGGTRYKILKVNNENQEVMSNLLDSYWTYPLKTYNRYYEKQPAAHIIGYITQWNNKGAAGLEKSYETILNASKPEIYATVDGLNNIIPGLGFKIKNNNKNGSIITTLDIELQKFVEKVMEDHDIKGSVVVLDPSNGHILACANYPSYDPDNVTEYLSGQDEEFFNRAIQVGYPPGSIFKIVVAAAALEAGSADMNTNFTCNGYELINDIQIKCSSFSRGGHGDISFSDAFSESCNSAFIQLGKMVGSDSILKMSKRFGLGQKTGIPIDEENAGNLPTVDEVKGAGIGNLSVEQGELLVTPLQVTRVTAIIANQGVDKGVTLVSEIIDSDGTSIQVDLPPQKRIISKDIAYTITEMMKETVQSGTADNLGQIFQWNVAGKTGSAESVYNNKEVVHGWFTGFLPADEPEYIITVFVEDGKSGRNSAVPVFKKIGEFLYQMDN